jgi:hypothetical protein
MLPDFPRTKGEILAMLLRRFRLKAQQGTPLEHMGTYVTLHEGKGFSYPQEGFGTIEDKLEEFKVPVSLNYGEVPNLTFQGIVAKVDGWAEDLARMLSKQMYAKLDEANDKAGTGVDAGGKEISQELLLEMFEKVELDFDADGKPTHVFVAHPTMAEHMHRKWQEWERDPEFMKKYNALMTRKHEEWRARESNRKLVD